MKLTWILFAAYLMTVALASGGDKDGVADQDCGDDDSIKIANATLPDGTEVDFFEREDGMILLVATGDAGDEGNGNRHRFLSGDDDDDDLSPAETYEKLTGKKALAALVDAEERSKGPHENADEAFAESDEDDGEVTEDDEDDGADRRFLRKLGSCGHGEAFKRKYCKHGGICFICKKSSKMALKLNRYKKVKSTAHAYKGNVFHKIRYKTSQGNYKLIKAKFVSTGKVNRIEAWFPKRIYWQTELRGSKNPEWNWNLRYT